MTSANLEPTANRLNVLEVVGNNSFPLSASDIFKTLTRSSSINRVTVYRILDLLVEHGIVDRISTGGRAAYFGMAPNAHHKPHPHFYCKICGRMDCLNPESLIVNTEPLRKNLSPEGSTKWKCVWTGSVKTVRSPGKDNSPFIRPKAAVQ